MLLKIIKNKLIKWIVDCPFSVLTLLVRQQEEDVWPVRCFASTIPKSFSWINYRKVSPVKQNVKEELVSGLIANTALPACSLPDISCHQGMIIHIEEQHLMLLSNLLSLLQF